MPAAGVAPALLYSLAQNPARFFDVIRSLSARPADSGAAGRRPGETVVYAALARGSGNASTVSMQRSRAILFHTGVYGAGNLLRAASSLLLLPLYTRYLSPADYGLVELLNIVVDLTALATGMRIGAALFKFHSDAATEAARQRVIATLFSLLVLSSLAGVLILLALSGPLAGWLGAPPGFTVALRCLAFNLVLTSINETYFAWLRVKDRSTEFVVGSVGRYLLQVALNIAFIAYLDFGYWGIIWATLISQGLMAACSCVRMRRVAALQIDRALARRFVVFSAPIMLAALGTYYLNFGNRYFLKLYAGLESVGIYALAYRFGLTFLNLFWAPFSTFWAARQYDYAREPGAGRFFGEVFLAANLMLLPAAAGVAVLTPPFVRLVAAPGFWPANDIVPWLVGACVLWCWTDFFRFGMLRSARTGFIAIAEVATVLLITLLLVILVPRHGAVGAAQATFAAYALRLACTVLVSRKLFVVEVPWPRVGWLLAGFIASGFVLSVWPMADLPALFVKPFGLAGICLLVLFSPIVPGALRARLLAGARLAVGRRGRKGGTA